MLNYEPIPTFDVSIGPGGDKHRVTDQDGAIYFESACIETANRVSAVCNEVVMDTLSTPVWLDEEKEQPEETRDGSFVLGLATGGAFGFAIAVTWALVFWP